MADSRTGGGKGALPLRPKILNFAVLPAQYARPAAGLQETVLVGLIVVGFLLILLSIVSRSDLQSDTSLKQSQLAQTNQSINQLRQGAQPQASQLRSQLDDILKRLQIAKADLDALKSRQLSWSSVLAKVFDSAPPGVSVDSLGQGGATLTLKGRGPDYPVALTYAEKLRDSGLFTSVAFQVIMEQGAAVPPAPSLSSTPAGGTQAPGGFGGSPTPGGSGVPPTPTPGAGVVQPPPTPIRTPTPVLLPTPVIQPTPIPAPTATPTLTPGPSPTPTATSTPLGTATPTATPTPSVDYAVVSRGFTDFINENYLNSIIGGRVIDPNNNPVPGLSFRLSSCCPDWSAVYPREWDPPSDGNFSFTVTSQGNYTLQILNGVAQAVTDLSTGGFRGYRVWDITFLKTRVGTPTPLIYTATPTPTGTVTPTPTGSVTPTPTGTVTPTPTGSVTPTPTFTFTPTPIPPTKTSTPIPVATTAIVGNFGHGDASRPLAGGGYPGLSVVEPVAQVLPAPRDAERSAVAATPVTFVIILEVKGSR
ncbi:MAG: hypothetical protein Q7R39_03415 [Dehalococcoidia bacterium]|nr:hypothetical protein [Dehalococcoidia bacterium]